MFSLRQIGEHRQRNTLIGKWYEFVGYVSHSKEYKIAFRSTFPDKEPPTSDEALKELEVFAFLSTPSGSYVPLYSNERNYIVSPNGQTFENLNAS